MDDLVAIGVDGGGTKTSTCCVSVSSKKVLSNIKTGSTNWNSVGAEVAKASLSSGILESIKQANSEGSKVAGIVLSMSGVDRPADKILVTSWIKEILPHLSESSIHIYSDAVAALASGTNGILHGVVVISGTGMISYGFEKSVKEKRAGGWGPLLGDEGSGYQIAYDVLKAVVCAHDGRGPETQLLKDVVETLEIEDPTQLIPWAYNEADRSWKKFADLAPLAYKCAKNGDSVALKILDNAAEQLLNTISAVVNGLDFGPNKSFPMVLAGGNLTHEGSLLSKLLEEKLKKSFPNCEIAHPMIEPEVAAALLGANKYLKLC